MPSKRSPATLVLSLLALAVAVQVDALGSQAKERDVVAHLFGWPWKSIENECKILAQAGYGYVQTSTAVEHIKGDTWWTDYQPVSYQLISKRGNREEFVSMVEACKSEGIDIIVDVLLNHMTGQSATTQQTGFAGSQFTKYSYHEYSPEDFHYCLGNGAVAEVTDYSSAKNVLECELSNLADLDQSRENVRDSLAALLNDFVSVGVAGFRLDAAKHIPHAQLLDIFQRVNGTILNFQEVYAGSNQPAEIMPDAYLESGKVIEFRATSNVLDRFKSSGIASFLVPTPMGEEWGFIPSTSANFIMANQDTERQAYDYGQPTIYSSYDYTNKDIAPSQDSDGYTEQVTCDENGWRCEHRWEAIARMVPFHNAVKSGKIANVATGNKDQLAFSRGNIGFVALNNQDSSWQQTFSTGLDAGTYCDIIHSNIENCKAQYNVDDNGRVSLEIGAYDAVAFYKTDSAPLIPDTGSGSAQSAGSTELTPSSDAIKQPSATNLAQSGSTRAVPFSGNFRFMPIQRAGRQ